MFLGWTWSWFSLLFNEYGCICNLLNWPQSCSFILHLSLVLNLTCWFWFLTQFCQTLQWELDNDKENLWLIISYWQHTLSSVQFSHSVVSNSLQLHELQHSRPPCLSPIPRVYSNSCSSSRWCHPTTSFSVIPFPPTFNLSQHQGLFQWVSSLHQVAKVLEFQLQHQSFQSIFRTDFL